MVSPCQCGAKRFWLGFLRDLLGTFFNQNIYQLLKFDTLSPFFTRHWPFVEIRPLPDDPIELLTGIFYTYPGSMSAELLEERKKDDEIEEVPDLVRYV